MMFLKKKKEEVAVRKTPLTVEPLLNLIKDQPVGLKLEEIQEILSKKNIEAVPSMLHEMLLKLEQEKAITSKIKQRKEGGWDKCWFSLLCFLNTSLDLLDFLDMTALTFL